MYKLLLIRKYLLKRRIAWVSLVAVALCTTMVLVVISVFGGWLRMFQDLNHHLVGDIVIKESSYQGFGHYEDMLTAIRSVPGVKGAVPIIHTYALLNIEGQIPAAVEVWAYGDLDQIDKVNNFHQDLYRQYQQVRDDIENDKSLSGDEKKARLDQLEKTPPNFDKVYSPEEYTNQYQLDHPDATIDVNVWPGLIGGSTTLGIHKNAQNQLGRGKYMDLVYHAWARLTMLDMGANGSMSGARQVSWPYWVVDDCRTGLYTIDANRVYVPFDNLQTVLGMTATHYTSMSDHTVHEDPARINQIEVGCDDGTDLEKMKATIDGIVQPIYRQDPNSFGRKLQVETWYQSQAPFLEAVEHEKVLTVILFAIISIVSIFLIFCIFFMIVIEKTRDIGIIKSVGATSGGVAGIFLGYGLTIGIVGGGLGLLGGYLIIHNINELHAWVAHETGVVIWSPETYVFDKIPSTMNPWEVTIIVSVAVLSALLGAIVPAIRAARMHPVEALRWE